MTRTHSSVVVTPPNKFPGTVNAYIHDSVTTLSNPEKCPDGTICFATGPVWFQSIIRPRSLTFTSSNRAPKNTKKAGEVEIAGNKINIFMSK